MLLFLAATAAMLLFTTIGCLDRKKKITKSAPNSKMSKVSSKPQCGVTTTMKESEKSTKKVEQKRSDTSKSREVSKTSKEMTEKTKTWEKTEKKDESEKKKTEEEESTKKKVKKTEESTKRESSMEEEKADDGWMSPDPTIDDGKTEDIKSMESVSKKDCPVSYRPEYRHKYANDNIKPEKYLIGMATKEEAEKKCVEQHRPLVLYYLTPEVGKVDDTTDLWIGWRILYGGFLHYRIKKFIDPCRNGHDCWRLVGYGGYYDSLSTLINYRLEFPLINFDGIPDDDNDDM